MRRHPKRRTQGGFNMVEIAICLGIIGIALVAIIGVMPTGTRAGQDNREETVIDQDGRYLMQAIRLGAPGDGQLAKNIESINGAPVADATEAIGKLSFPGTNVAVVRGLSGPAAERGAEVAFRYQLTTTIRPFSGGSGGNPQLQNYLHEVQLHFEWPLRPDGQPANRAGSGSPKTFRLLVSGRLEQTNNLAFFRP